MLTYKQIVDLLQVGEESARTNGYKNDDDEWDLKNRTPQEIYDIAFDTGARWASSRISKVQIGLEQGKYIK